MNLAASLARLQLGRVLLVDANHPVPGDASLLSGVEAPRALAHLASIAHTMGPEVFDTYLSCVGKSLALVNLCSEPTDEASLSPDLMIRFVELAEMLFDLVVVDLPAASGPLTRPLLDRSDAVVVVSSPAPTALLRARRTVASLRAWQVPSECLSLCLNRVIDPDAFSTRRVEEDVEARCAALVPDDGVVVERALAAGRTLVEFAPRAAATQAIERLARELGVRTLDRSRRSGAWERRQHLPSDDADRRVAMKVRIHRRLVDEVDLRKADVAYLADPVKLQELRARVESTLVSLLDEEAQELTDRGERRQLLKELLDEALGLGPLEDLLNDHTITEDHGEPPRPDLRRAGRPPRARVRLRSRAPTRSAASSSASSRRSAAASTRSCRWWTRAWPTARASTPSSPRWRSAARR